MKLKEEKKEMDKKFNDEIETIEKEKQKIVFLLQYLCPFLNSKSI